MSSSRPNCWSVLLTPQIGNRWNLIPDAKSSFDLKRAMLHRIVARVVALLGSSEEAESHHDRNLASISCPYS